MLGPTWLTCNSHSRGSCELSDWRNAVVRGERPNDRAAVIAWQTGIKVTLRTCVRATQAEAVEWRGGPILPPPLCLRSAAPHTRPLLSNGRSSSIVLMSHASSSAEQRVGTLPFLRHMGIVANEHLRALPATPRGMGRVRFATGACVQNGGASIWTPWQCPAHLPKSLLMAPVVAPYRQSSSVRRNIHC